VLLATVIEVVWMGKRMERWIACLIAGLDTNVDEGTTIKVLEQCGRQCQSESFVKKARDIYQRSESMNEFLDKLGKLYKHLHKEGDNVYIIYPKCYCSFVNKIPPRKLSATYCNCSRGWAKALFEGALGRPVEVVMEQSIVKGDDQCKFRIIL
jgi:predicted hydrocarbon binding protein